MEGKHRPRRTRQDPDGMDSWDDLPCAGVPLSSVLSLAGYIEPKPLQKSMLKRIDEPGLDYTEQQSRMDHMI